MFGWVYFFNFIFGFRPIKY